MTAQQAHPQAPGARLPGTGPGRRPEQAAVPAAVPALPAARGPLSGAVARTLAAGPPPGAARDVTGTGHAAGAAVRRARDADPYGEDLQLALHTCFELHYRGFAGVDPDWEWDPGLLRLRGAMEERFLSALRRDVADGGAPADGGGAGGSGARGCGDRGGADVDGALGELLTEPAGARGVTHHLRDEGEWWQLREHAALRSVYHLKEADPHAWVVPRLRGRAKTALVAVEHDEFGGGRPEMIHQGLYAGLLDDLGLDSSYGAHVGAAPAVMLATVNMMSLFGLRRSLRGALVGHFAAAEITTAPAARRMARALERLGAGPRARLFYTEHIEADAVHEQVLRHDVIGGLLEDEPGLAADVVFGVRATGLLEDRLAAHLLGSWLRRPPRSALRRPLPDSPAGPAAGGAAGPVAGSAAGE
ncbi:iron-containing redox enzyme family protein [Actinomadura sp. 7K507]|uniref:iron-containing redox enzyme family protein n=1 Tax=Actinomadura sp. 7K507 TaxID=2530365 RepID=UPI001047E5CD|nr:iron-containing redox enzyme family protein [Actinomadura sp. 7K507]TDC75503.1 iron-containing redox enzyme family protein [Actinomadura sp. 7K507]